MPVCAYCGLAKATSSDHVPPKLLLRKPFRPNLRTVPSCIACNNRTASAEEYFRRVLVIYLAHTPEADELFDGPVSRALDKGPGVEARTWGAIHADEHGPFVDLDTAALASVAAKIVQGLAYLDDRPLPPASSLSYRFYEVEHRPPEVSATLARSRLDSQDGPSFAHRTATLEDPDLDELWELVFFDAFCCAVGVKRPVP